MSNQEQYQAFCQTPTLFVNQEITTYPSFSTNISDTEICDSELKYSPFGKRMEQFLVIYFEQSDRYEVIAHGLQINKEKITLGELDFLVRNTSQNSIIHIELVTKFYVYDPTEKEEINRWIGPNKKDSLVQKLDKLKKKQLPLLFNPYTKVELQKFGIDPKTVEQMLCFKAQLYIPYQFETKLIEPIVNIDCITGFWLRPKELQGIEFRDAKFNIPLKNNWYCSPNNETEWEDLSSLSTKIAKLHKMEKSPLIWINKRGSIFEKCFIVWW